VCTTLLSMCLATTAGGLRWRVALPAPREDVWALLATDAGRERFWAETSQQSGKRVELRFADGTTTRLEVLASNAPTSIAVRYFDAKTTFELTSTSGGLTLLEVTADNVLPADTIDVAAGWVSVLLCLKAYVMAGLDLRNHDPRYAWSAGFVDN
jgi:uncharacterized protein YndB with AHSA1/START domain